jgi:hypothetical protein
MNKYTVEHELSNISDIFMMRTSLQTVTLQVYKQLLSKFTNSYSPSLQPVRVTVCNLGE